MGVVSPTSLEEYRVLKEELLEHGRRYYGDDAPIISDAEYDQRFRALLTFEAAHPDQVAPDSPSQRVGAAPRSDLFAAHAVGGRRRRLGGASADRILAFRQRT